MAVGQRIAAGSFVKHRASGGGFARVEPAVTRRRWCGDSRVGVSVCDASAQHSLPTISR